LCPLLVETTGSASGPPERLPAGRVRGPDDHRAVGGDGAGWPGPGPGGALGPVGPDPVAGAGVGRDPPATGISRRGSSRARAPTARSVAWCSASTQCDCRGRLGALRARPRGCPGDSSSEEAHGRTEDGTAPREQAMSSFRDRLHWVAASCACITGALSGTIRASCIARCRDCGAVTSDRPPAIP
jgi:hypothetical protein